MTRRKELPWPVVRNFWHNLNIADLGSGEFAVLRKSHAEMLAELVRRVLEKDDFTEFAKKCQKEIFNINV